MLELVRGDDVLGTIDVKAGHADYPWYSGVFHPSAAFDSVRHLFDDELRLLKGNTTDDPAQINLQSQMVVQLAQAYQALLWNANNAP